MERSTCAARMVAPKPWSRPTSPSAPTCRESDGGRLLGGPGAGGGHRVALACATSVRRLLGVAPASVDEVAERKGDDNHDFGDGECRHDHRRFLPESFWEHLDEVVRRGVELPEVVTEDDLVEFHPCRIEPGEGEGADNADEERANADAREGLVGQRPEGLFARPEKHPGDV